MSKVNIGLLLINFLIMRLVSQRLGQIGLVLLFIKYFIDMGVFSRTKFINEIFKKSDLFYWEYQGDYRKLYSKFKKLGDLYSKYSFNRNLWNTFGVYYDDPKTTLPDKCRAVIGFQYIKDSNKNEKEDLINFLKAEGFKHKNISNTNCIVAKYPHVNFLSIIFATKKFYSNLEKKIKDLSFLKKFGLENKEPKFTCTFEIYRDNDLVFGFPIENEKDFLIYSN